MTDRPETTPAAFDSVLLDTVREIDRYAAGAGWDRPPRLFALVETAKLLQREPALGSALGIDEHAAAELTPVEQDALPADRDLDDVLATMAWPEEVAGCAIVVERLVLPPSAEADLPQGDAGDDELSAAAAGHADRQEVRMVVAVLRDGRRECALRLRAHDTEAEVLTGPDLVPALADALFATLA